jgi:hypothetical protein
VQEILGGVVDLGSGIVQMQTQTQIPRDAHPKANANAKHHHGLTRITLSTLCGARDFTLEITEGFQNAAETLRRRRGPAQAPDHRGRERHGGCWEGVWARVVWWPIRLRFAAHPGRKDRRSCRVRERRGEGHWRVGL